MLALIEFLVVLDTAIVNLALPSIQQDLGFTPAGLPWVVNAYLVTFAGLLLVGGRAADLWGRRRLFLIGLAVFTLASLGNALATAPWQLVLGRAVQGLGGALVVPAAIALISDLFDQPRDRARALGYFSGMGGAAAALGAVGGGLLSSAGWHWIFVINVPIGGLVLALGAWRLPSGAPGQAGRNGHVIPRGLLRVPGLRVGNPALVVIGSLMFGTFFIMTLYLQQVRGLPPHLAGLVYLPVSLGVIAGTQVAPRLALRRGPRAGLSIGLGLQGVGLAWWALTMAPGAALVGEFLAPAVLWALGAGMALVSAFILSTVEVPEELAGAASGLATTSQNAGGVIGLTVLAAIAQARTSDLGQGGPAEALTSGYALAVAVAAALALITLVLVHRTAGDRSTTPG